MQEASDAEAKNETKPKAKAKDQEVDGVLLGSGKGNADVQQVIFTQIPSEQRR